METVAQTRQPTIYSHMNNFFVDRQKSVHQVNIGGLPPPLKNIKICFLYSKTLPLYFYEGFIGVAQGPLFVMIKIKIIMTKKNNN